MTTFRREMYTCAVCKREARFPVLTSSNSFGPPDLDGRPAGMIRFALHMQIQQCPHCGYVARNIEKKTKATRLFLLSRKYRTCEGLKIKSALGRTYYQGYMIYSLDGDPDTAAYWLHQAAWACDDFKDRKNAIACRKKWLLLDRNPLNDDTGDMVIRADMMRRSEQFDLVVDTYEKVVEADTTNSYHMELLAFEVQKAKEKDAGCYTVWQAAKPRLEVDDDSDWDEEDDAFDGFLKSSDE